MISGRFGYKVLANKYNTMTHKQNCSLLNQYGRGGNPCDCGATERDWEKDFEEFFSNTTDRSKFCEFISYREVKDFIKDVESSAEQRGREEVSGEYALSLIPEEKDMSNESIKLHTFSEAGFILGWNACRKAMIDKINSGE